MLAVCVGGWGGPGGVGLRGGEVSGFIRVLMRAGFPSSDSSSLCLDLKP